MRDSSPVYARRPPLTEREITKADFRYTRMAHGVRSLDDSVATILSSLGDRTRDTLVIYLSDNGFLFGEHRRFGKENAYEGSVRVPMVIRVPATLSARTAFTSHALVSNVDIAPTLAAVAGFPWQADGRSLVPLLDGSTKSVRSALLIEHCRGVNVGSVPCSGLSFVAQVTRVAGYWGVVTARDKYVSYDTGDRELFDLETDPSELHNLIGSSGSAATVADMEAKLAALLRPRSRDDDRDRSLAVGSAAQPDGSVHVLLAVALLHVPLPPDSGQCSEHVARLRPAGGGVRRPGRRRLPVRGGRDR